MKNLLHALLIFSLIACAQEEGIEITEQAAIGTDSPLYHSKTITDDSVKLASWLSLINPKDSFWVDIPDNFTGFSPDIKNNPFLLFRVPYQKISEAKIRYEKFRAELIEVKKQIVSDNQIHYTADEGILYSLYVTTDIGKIPCDEIIKNIEWIKLKGQEIDFSAEADWVDDGHPYYRFQLQHECIQDCTITAYGTNDGHLDYSELSGWSLNTSNEDSDILLPLRMKKNILDTIWAIDFDGYFNWKDFDVVKDWGAESSEHIWDYLFDHKPLPIWSAFKAPEKEVFPINYIDLAEIGGYEKELNTMRILHAERRQEIEEEERRKSEEERRKKEEPCEGISNCSYEVREYLEGAGWELVGDVLYYGKGVYYALGAKPMETGVKQIYYTMDCDCQPIGLKMK